MVVQTMLAAPFLFCFLFLGNIVVVCDRIRAIYYNTISTTGAKTPYEKTLQKITKQQKNIKTWTHKMNWIASSKQKASATTKKIRTSNKYLLIQKTTATDDGICIGSAQITMDKKEINWYSNHRMISGVEHFAVFFFSKSLFCINQIARGKNSKKFLCYHRVNRRVKKWIFIYSFVSIIIGLLIILK